MNLDLMVVTLIFLHPSSMTSQLGITLLTSPIRIGYCSVSSNYAAINIAVADAQLAGMLPNENFSYVYREAYCDPNLSVKATIDLALLDNIDVFIGPSCSQACETAGYIASYWNLPMFPETCSSSSIDNKTTYNTVVRLLGSYNSFGISFTRIFEYYGWTEIVLISDAVPGPCVYGATAIDKTVATTKNISIKDWIQLSAKPSNIEISNALSQLSERGRIAVMCHTTLSVVGQILFAAQDAGMTNGDYAFFTFSLLPGLTNDNIMPWMNYNLTDQNLTYRMTAFYSLKQMTLPMVRSNASTALVAEVTQKNTEPPWNIPPPFNQAVGALVPYVYDATYLYMILANETISEGLDYRNGTLIFQKSIGRTFAGMSGQVTIGKNGDRQPSPILWAIEPNTSIYTVYMSVDTVDNTVTVYRTNVVWGPTSNPPRDIPVCGFLNQLCPPAAYSVSIAAVIGGTVAGSVCLIIILVTLYSFRLMRNETRIRQMVWKINYDDLQFIKTVLYSNTALQRASRHVLKSSSQAFSRERIASIDVCQEESRSARLAVYRGTVVSVRVLIPKKREFSMTRGDNIDLINLKDLVHDNVQPFIGVCVDPGRIFVVVLHCSRGCLQDILNDDNIKLDWFFRISLISDLANGILYLHKSAFHSHGHISSVSCYVDNRWMLKVSCILPPALRDSTSTGKMTGTDSIDSTESSETGFCYKDLLWTAPELLRMEVPPIYGTQKGDVYSFAIVAQEIAYRAPPFFNDDLNAKDIIAAVYLKRDKPYRPIPTHELVEMPEMTSLISRCWAEAPLDRPAFDDIVRQFRRFNNGRKFEIVDHVLQKLEKYANNLETVVEQRTSELLDEKQKTDLLLHRMLPPYVAEQLKIGRTVLPEMYRSVTVYFSDIVGFTRLSSESSPMQVVDLLNDLYGTFDDTISRHDVYKVETIGDAYMVVSGVPKPNGGHHIIEICNMALDLLKEASAFKIRHQPEEKLCLRIGIHTGPCAAGVIGHTMPRYCLFGDTVNVASRMESTGEARRIHLSAAAKEELDKFVCYETEPRGEIFVKGKGMMMTYWLNGKQLMVT